MTIFGLSFGYFWRFIREGRRRKWRREEEEKANKGLDTCLNLLWFCLNIALEVFVWILVVPFLGFS